MNKKLILLCSVLAVSGCTTTRVNPIQGKIDGNVCVVNNAAVREAFADIYISQLKSNGYQVKIILSKENAAGCEYVSTYTASWKYHWGPYLSFARIAVYQDEMFIGDALYKAPYASPAKYIHSAPKIQELVDKLFPKKQPAQDGRSEPITLLQKN